MIKLNTWKKFLLKIFKNNYEKSNGNNQNQTTFEERHDHIRTIETRVKYKYPKGEFRFPLIKDPPKNEQRKPLERTKRHTDQTLGKSEASYTVQKVERKRNQPFTPTHIPSPIYGFNRPKKENFEQRVEKEELESGNQQAMNDIDSHSLSPPIFHKHSTEEVKSNTQQLNETTNNLPCKQSESIHQREEGANGQCGLLGRGAPIERERRN